MRAVRAEFDWACGRLRRLRGGLIIIQCAGGTTSNLMRSGCRCLRDVIMNVCSHFRAGTHLLLDVQLCMHAIAYGGGHQVHFICTKAFTLAIREAILSSIVHFIRIVGVGPLRVSPTSMYKFATQDFVAHPGCLGRFSQCMGLLCASFRKHCSI